MGHRRPVISWETLDTPDRVSEQAAQRVLAAARAAIAARGRFSIVLAGGKTPERTYARLRSARTAWARWMVYFGDERCLPWGDPDRNDAMADRAWLSHVPIPAGNIHRIPAELGPEQGAQAYAVVLEEQLPFDMVLLGLGEDGHTASLFSSRPCTQGMLVLPVYQAPKPPPERVTLSATALSQTRAMLVLVTGAGKGEAVRAWRRGEPLPIASLHPACGMTVLLDMTATFPNGCLAKS